jgi:beta-galactosidase
MMRFFPRVSGRALRARAIGGAEGFFPTGVGWYRRSFDSPKDWSGQRVTVEFEGVYMNARASS